MQSLQGRVSDAHAAANVMDRQVLRVEMKL